MTEIYKLAENIYRVKHWERNKIRETLLTKYNIINVAPNGEPELIYSGEDSTAVLENGYKLEFSLSAGEMGGFDIRLPLDPADRLYGLGDVDRQNIEKRGHSALMQIANVHAYGPIPYLMSSRGWGIMVLSTFSHTFDMGETDPDLLHIYSQNGALDFIVVCGTSLKDALYLQGIITGRPVMLPKASYGLTVVMNEDQTARGLLDDAVRFKDRNIPCDTFGLEPSWMETFYDFSTEKKWDPKRFPLWDWMGIDAYYANFVEALNTMGYSLSLWLCCDYDLFWHEENEACGIKPDSPTKKPVNAVIQDENLVGTRRLDRITKRNEPWFDHIKKFVNNGAEAFKMDGSCQVIPFPDRVWADKYLDSEIKNLYPVVYAKQMKEGYQNHCGRRAMNNSVGAYLGIQKYTASWAGDTGGSLGVLVSLMNYAMCGHSNASFDMYSGSPTNLHAGFLAPWTQHMGWSCWNMPWYQKKESENSYRYYSQLRSQLFPYIYSFAHVANETSYPMLRPLSLVYNENVKYDTVKNEYMLGDAFLVNAWDLNVTLPEEDEWFDFFTGKKQDGPREFLYTPAPLHGGGLFVRAGSIVVMQDWNYSLRDYRPSKLYIHVYPGKDTEFTLYEDDYYSYAYENGEYATTKITLENNVLKIHPRAGSFHYHTNPRHIKPGVNYEANTPAAVDFDVIWHHEDGTTSTYTIPAADYANAVVEIEDR